MKVAIVGAGWAGMAAAVTAVQAGHETTVFEAARSLGGRARALPIVMPDGSTALLDNGQHILIGAYTHTLHLMRRVGLDPEHVLHRQALALPFVDGSGLQTPVWAAHWPAPLDALAAIATARGWSMRDRWSLLRAALGWQLKGFQCRPLETVATLCHGISEAVRLDMIEPLCVSALNTPAAEASGQVFLKVLQDALFSLPGGSHLLLPQVDLTRLFPLAAQQWMATDAARASGGSATVHCGHRVQDLAWRAPHWLVDGQAFDRVIWATASSNAVPALVQHADAAPDFVADALRTWAAQADALHYEAIATVYVQAPGLTLPHRMLSLRSTAQHPAQFVFDRGQLGGPTGLLAFVVSASQGSREAIEAAVLNQAAAQLGHLHADRWLPVQTVVEKRATFACTPGLVRPGTIIAPGLVAAGDYVLGPYPATLEGAVRSGIDAVKRL